ncbi:MAG TPA: NAD(P)/FAD-dependent oxidoreductase [Candidatus Acidoferrales bacterium]|nr:NAD(P)/FAD-dependent oxidoreductase [Candidatus Acidoferrales bacterium]
MDRANVLIVGGGVVGCAVAEALSRRWADVFLVEKNPKFGMATSSRNSGVIHSGIYYPKDSWKAKLCVAGNRLTKEFCVRHKVPHRTTGKLVVAKDAGEEAELLALKKKGEENGVEGLRLIDAVEIRRQEPHVKGHAALEVPSTGICSAEELVHAYARVAEGQGAHLVNYATVVRMEPQKDSVRVTLRIGDEEASEEETIEAQCVVNSAGLYADEVAGMLGPRPWRIYPVRGEYCEIRGAKAELIRNLVYPLPHHDQLTLGVHFTKTLWGTTLVGPTATYVDGKENYERGRMEIAEFAADAKTMLPEISAEDLQLGYSGLRPKLKAEGEKGVADFVIEADREVPRMIQLVGIESPGLTAAGAIAERVAGLVGEVLG